VSDVRERVSESGFERAECVESDEFSHEGVQHNPQVVQSLAGLLQSFFASVAGRHGLVLLSAGFSGFGGS